MEHALKLKTGLVAAVIGACRSPSKRMEYIELLQNEGITVHVYGFCGNYTYCLDHKKPLNAGCDIKDLSLRYKFILSFENSICSDYVTEKMYEAMLYNWIPIVRGGADYKTLVPKHSVIDASNQPASELARVIRTLDADDNEYLKFFQWKKTTAAHVFYGWDACMLCQKLRRALNAMNETRLYRNFNSSFGFANEKSAKAGLLPKTYTNLSNWWYTQSNCVVGNS
jgi:alpha-1,3-fucosyltransferase